MNNWKYNLAMGAMLATHLGSLYPDELPSYLELGSGESEVDGEDEDLSEAYDELRSFSLDRLDLRIKGSSDA